MIPGIYWINTVAMDNNNNDISLLAEGIFEVRASRTHWMGSCGILDPHQGLHFDLWWHKTASDPYPRHVRNLYHLHQRPTSVSCFWVLMPQHFSLCKGPFPSCLHFHSKSLKTVFPHQSNTTQLLTFPHRALPHSRFTVPGKAPGPVLTPALLL